MTQINAKLTQKHMFLASLQHFVSFLYIQFILIWCFCTQKPDPQNDPKNIPKTAKKRQNPFWGVKQPLFDPRYGGFRHTGPKTWVPGSYKFNGSTRKFMSYFYP